MRWRCGPPAPAAAPPELTGRRVACESGPRMNESSATVAAGELDVVAACALHAMPGVGNSSLHAIRTVFKSLHQAFAAGPGELLDRADDLKLHAATREYLAKGPDLDELGRWAIEEARRAGARILLFGDP